MNLLSRAKLSVVAAGVVFCGAAVRVAAQQPDPRADPRLGRTLSVEVRSADVADVVTRLSDALDIGLEAHTGLRGRRVTLYATKASVYSIQEALASLYHSRWKRFGDGEKAYYQLLNSEVLDAQADRLRQGRRTNFVTRLLQTEVDLRRRDPGELAVEFRSDVATRVPDITEQSLEGLSPDFLRQMVLLSPLRIGMTPGLHRNGGVWASYHDLPAAYQQLLADFYLYRDNGSPDPSSVDRVVGAAEQRVEPEPEVPTGDQGILGAQVLNYPQARLEYRLLYGDRWTGPLLVVRVGSSDNWATATLPSILFDLHDDASLFPEAARHPGDPMLERNLNVRIDTAAMTWDQALATIVRGAGLNVLTDSYLRPAVFRPKGPAPIIVGTTVRETLDRVSRYYGYVWWRHADFFLFRHRYWSEEQRVSTPERLSQGIAESLVDSGRLSAADLKALSQLTDEQLLTLHLYGKARGKPWVTSESFDLNDVQLIQAGLMLAGEMTDAQRGMARRDGLPYFRMSQSQQQLFNYLAFDRGLPVIWEEAVRWRLRMRDDFARERLPAGWAEVGNVRFTFDYGTGGRRTADLLLRVPATDRPAPAQMKKEGP